MRKTPEKLTDIASMFADGRIVKDGACLFYSAERMLTRKGPTTALRWFMRGSDDLIWTMDRGGALSCYPDFDTAIAATVLLHS